jgi:hypothetical protein
MGDTKTKPFELKQFIKRRRAGQMVRVGVMYAQAMPGGMGGIGIGYSLCSKTDVFDAITAEDIAFNRSLAYVERDPYFRKVIDTTNGIDELRQYVDVKGIRMRPISQTSVEVVKNLFPDSIATDLAVFIGRAERFFKEYKLPEWATLYYADHQELVEVFFKKLAEKKAVNLAVEAITNG